MTGDQVGRNARMSLLEHLTELRKRLFVSLATIAGGAVICWIFYPEILNFLLDPYCRNQDLLGKEMFGQGCELLVTDPIEPFSVRLMVAGYGGLTLAIPVLLWQAWRFIAPGLYRRERRWAIPFVLAGVILFAAGVLLAYWTIPRALSFLAHIGGPDLVTVFSPAKYLSFVVKMTVAFGLAFEFPLFLVFLQMIGVIKTQQLRAGRRYAIVGIVALVAVLTPSGDPLTLLILSIPMLFFYEFAIVFGRIRERRLRNLLPRDSIDDR